MDEKRGLRPWIINRVLVRIKVPDSGREEARQMLYEPRVWLKGEHLAGTGVLQPWEKLLWGVAAFLRNSSSQFDGRDRLWRTVYGVQPVHIMWQSIANTIWDGINDPLVGQFMDRRPFKDNTYRWFMRINHIIGQGLTLFFMLDLGLDPVQRVVIFGVIQAARNIFQTMAGIADEKFFAGLTPLSEERAKLQVWQHSFHKIAYPIANMPQYLQGFIVGERRYVWTDQRIFIVGFAVLIPLSLAGGIIHTFARNRVTFDHTKNAQAAKANDAEDRTNVTPPKLTIREMFSVIKHNKFLLYWMIANFFNQLIPTFDSWLVWRFLVPSIRVGGLEVGGPAIPALMGQFTGAPITFLVPFMRQIVNVVGGPKRMLVLSEISEITVRIAQYFIGYNTRGRIFGHFALDTIRETVVPIAGVANRVLDFEMLDLVEYKTGVRSEGINRAITGFVEKLIKNNIETVTGNLFQQWAQVYTIDGNVPNPVIPERFARWAWPVWILGGALSRFIMLIARASFPYKVGQNEYIEAELKARRELADKAQREMEEELETAGKP